MSLYDRSLVWFRRDLRHHDHAALHHALTNSRAVTCVFVFDREILDPLLESGLRADRRVEFILESVRELDAALREKGGSLVVRHGFAREVIPELAGTLNVDAVVTNHDYEPAALVRDRQVARALEQQGRRLVSFKDQVVFEKDEVLTQAGKPFTVYTPYRNAWLKKLMPDPAAAAADLPALGAWLIEPSWAALVPGPQAPMPTLESLGFEKTNLAELGIPTGMSGAGQLLADFLPRIGRYDRTRDFPAVRGPSYLSIHLRFGTIPVRALARQALDAMRSGAGDGARTWLHELVWRDFYFAILHHFPHVDGNNFRAEFDQVEWEQGPEADQALAAWCEGRTGFPLVDAGMRQLNQTGYMHNRLRMVTASFLVKDLGIDWRRGERYFAQRLNDYDMAANNGGWQWAASTGCDAQPWFRIFNPVTQSEKFDADGKFIRRYVPELAKLPSRALHAPWMLSTEELNYAGISRGETYPRPIVMHDEARKRTLARFSVLKKTGEEPVASD